MSSNKKRKARVVRHMAWLILIITSALASWHIYLNWYHNSFLSCGKFSSTDSSGLKISTPRLCFEIAKTEGERQKGLMFRKLADLKEQQGMLFIFPKESKRSFWMKNTFIPLDMIFIDSKKQVVGVIERTAPLTESARQMDIPSQYVVEINAGLAKKWGINAGSNLELEGALPQVSE